MNYFETAVENIKNSQRQLLEDLFEKVPLLQTITVEFGYYEGDVSLEAVNGVKIKSILDIDFVDYKLDYNSDDFKSFLVEANLTCEEMKSICVVLDNLRYCPWLKGDKTNGCEVTIYRNQYIQDLSNQATEVADKN